MHRSTKPGKWLNHKLYAWSRNDGYTRLRPLSFGYPSLLGGRRRSGYSGLLLYSRVRQLVSGKTVNFVHIGSNPIPRACFIGDEFLYDNLNIEEYILETRL